MSHNRESTACCCGAASTDNRTAAVNPAAKNLLDPDGHNQTTCPVMPGTAVSKSIAEAAGLFRDYRGRRYWFCCRGCGPRFDRDPDRYAGVV